jgi:hypothetical protein
MITQIDVSQMDESVFTFDNFEFVLYSDSSYILSDEGYFLIEGLQSFKKIDDITYILINEEGDKMIISEQDFEKIKDIYLKFA